ncbi:MAG: right-handed parallel beta-helix repeat-containing protein [Ruminococcaceae bacterium]|nr:right-handed parallel beta-helix repeat-containing protein [Oscillospiraceae bacterium]
MKRSKPYLRPVLALALALSLTLLCGCGGKAETPKTEPAPAQTTQPETSGQAVPAQTTTPAPTPAPTPAGEPQSAADDGAVCVNSVEALLEAIVPGAKIVLDAGRYNLTDFLADYPNTRDLDQWNDAHEYVKLQHAFDGTEVVVRGITGLSLRGGSEDRAATELVIEPRYASVFVFEDCEGVELSCLTMGHTDGGDCSGNVLDFYNCQHINLRNLDLYGCGAYGVSAMGGTGDLLAADTVIRDCSFGPFEIYSGAGEFRFTDCTLTGSEGGGDYEPEPGSSLAFINCSFGQEESNRWFFSQEDGIARFENCTWTEATEYPDVGLPELPDFDVTKLTPVDFGETSLAESIWTGCATVDPKTGQYWCMGYYSYLSVTGPEYCLLKFSEDGTGVLDYGDGKLPDFEWHYDDPTTVCLEFDHLKAYGSLYRGSDDTLWFVLQYGDEVIWYF